MEVDLPVREDLVIPGWEMWFTASRASGPGGQHVNTSSTRVTLHWRLSDTTALDTVQRERVLRRLANRVNADGVLQVSSEQGRSQLENKQAARARLAELVAAALMVPKRRRPTRPTKGSQQRRITAKKERAEVKKQRQKPPPQS